MAMTATYCGEDTWSDGVDWSFGVAITNTETGQPLDITGSAFRCTFRALGDGALVLDAATGDVNGTITITDGPAGKIKITVPYRLRQWRAPMARQLGLDRITDVVGDLVRKADPLGPLALEDEARIRLKVRPSSTQILSDDPVPEPASSYAPVDYVDGQIAELSSRIDALGGNLQVAAGIALGGHRVVRAGSDGRLIYASSLVAGDVAGALGITIGAAEAGADTNVISSGDVTEPSWSWTPGNPIWSGPNGTLVQPAPATGDLRQIAVAITSTRIAVMLGAPLLRS